MWIFPTETPEILWRYTTGGRIITPPVEGSDGTIYFCSEDRYLYALNTDGTILWRNNLEDRITETLSLGYDGTLYAGSKRGYFIAVNPMGEKIWKIKLKGAIVGNPAIAPDGSLFIVTNEGWFYSISHTGFVRWEVKLPAIPVLGPVLGSDIYLALDNERVYSYNINGRRQWVFLLSGNAQSLALSKEKIYAGTDNSTLVSIDFTGSRIWNISLSGSVNSVLLLAENRILCTSGNYIYMMDSDGINIWSKIERYPQIDLAVISNLIVSLDSKGSIYWWDLEGLPVSKLDGGVPVRRFLCASEGSIYLGSKDWLFYKYGLPDIINNNYIEYLWPSYRRGTENRGYLLTNETNQNKNKIFISSDYVYLTEISKILDEKILIGLLDEIQIRLYKRDYDAGKSYLLDILELLASDCITRPLYEEGRLINNFPVVRSRAIDILGITGNYKTIEFIVDMLNYEWDSYVVDSIIRSLGNLRSDKEEIITKGITTYYNNNENNGNERFLRQILLIVPKIKSYNGTVSRDILAVITDILLTTSSRSTKELALDTINSIKK